MTLPNHSDDRESKSMSSQERGSEGEDETEKIKRQTSPTTAYILRFALTLVAAAVADATRTITITITLALRYLLPFELIIIIRCAERRWRGWENSHACSTTSGI